MVTECFYCGMTGKCRDITADARTPVFSCSGIGFGDIQTCYYRMSIRLRHEGETWRTLWRDFPPFDIVAS